MLHTISIADIPDHVITVSQLLTNAGFDSYIVGGSVRDLLLKNEPHDWDLTTNALPEEIVSLAEEVELKVVYENTFGTVSIIFEDEPLDSPVRTIEITPYRAEGKYSDKRRPDSVIFSKTLEEDLIRRDFTINAMAYDISHETLIDLHGGISDLEKKLIRTVGDPDERFSEDVLRIMRCIRFASQLDFFIEEKTFLAIKNHTKDIQQVSWERIRDEFTKMMLSDQVFKGMELLRETGLISHISPELSEGIGIEQNRSHIYSVWEHNIRAGQTAAEQGWPLHIRLSALLHDIGKPRTKRFDRKKRVTTFFGHEVVGARMAKKFMERLRYPKRLTELVVKLVRYHMFFSDPDAITLSAIRRMIKNVGKDHIWDLMNVRRSDRIGMGRPKAAPYRLRMYESMIEEALRDPIDVKMLKMNGDIMINELGMKPGREIGWILHALLEEVLDDPQKNNREYLEKRTNELRNVSREELERLGRKGKETQEKADEAAVKQLRSKHKVKFEGKRSKR